MGIKTRSLFFIEIKVQCPQSSPALRNQEAFFHNFYFYTLKYFFIYGKVRHSFTPIRVWEFNLIYYHVKWKETVVIYMHDSFPNFQFSIFFNTTINRNESLRLLNYLKYMLNLKLKFLWGVKEYLILA